MSFSYTITLSSSESLLSSFLYSLHQWPSKSPNITPLSCSTKPPFHTRRRRRRKKLTNPLDTSSHDRKKLEAVIDINDLSAKASSSFRTLFSSPDSRISRFISSGEEAYSDLQTLIAFDENCRIVISCRRSTIQFVGTLAIWGLFVVFALRVLINLGSRFRRRNGIGYNPVVRRDRSLGGREVVVGSRVEERRDSRNKVSKLQNPLSSAEGVMNGFKRGVKRSSRVGERLPNWWQTPAKPPVSLVDQQDYQREANRVVRAIMEKRMIGKDITENDIIQLRYICRTSGVQVTIETENIRDSIYRTSIGFVLNVCSRALCHSTLVQIDGEDVRQFVSGFADNIGLQSVNAARIVSGAVAARTRSCLLQAWALELQGKHEEAKVELSKMCLILKIFPPEESSVCMQLNLKKVILNFGVCSLQPEMEMVAHSLEKKLKTEQREHLLDLILAVCGEESHRIAREALGLVPYKEAAPSAQFEDFD